MTEEVDAETQAAMKLKLMDGVRTLIRDEMALALQDTAWLSALGSFGLGQVVLREFHPSNQEFRSKVRETLKVILQNSYT